MSGEPQCSIDTKSSLFELARSTGLFRVGRYLQRNSGKLLVLCYHGISKEDEHQWRPALYMPRNLFRQRLQTLHKFGYQVLPLSIAIERLYAQTLSGPTAVITFDDGWHDFYSEAWPELRSFGYPATVYQTTYYSLYGRPVFDTACSYLLWKGMGRTIKDAQITGIASAVKLDSLQTINHISSNLGTRLRTAGSSAEDKDRLLVKIAEHLQIDFDRVFASRLLHLMNVSELSEISKHGIDVQLHTHRHQLPVKRQDFLDEIKSNRDLIEAATGKPADHFCYPNGDYRPELPAWLKEAGVLSATTCEPGIVSRNSEPLRLPRVTDAATVSQARFESWLSGVGLLVNSCKRKVSFFAGYSHKDSNRQAQGCDPQQQIDKAGKSVVPRTVSGN